MGLMKKKKFDRILLEDLGLVGLLGEDAEEDD